MSTNADDSKKPLRRHFFASRINTTVSSFFILIVLLLFTCAPFVHFAYRVDYFALRTPLFMLIAFLLGLIFIILFCFFQSKASAFMTRLSQYLENPRVFLALVLCSVVLMSIWNAVLYIQGGFFTGWDAYSLIIDFMDSEWISYKLSLYPNLIFLCGLFDKLMAIGSCLSFENNYLILVLFSYINVVLSLVLIVYSAKRILGSTWALILLILSSFIGASPWFFVPYSDTFGMLPVSLSIWIFTYLKQYSKIFSFLSAILLIIGLSIKPTIIFIICSLF